MASGHNHIENCIYYARNQLNASRGEFDDYIARINQVADTVSHSLEQFTKDFNTMEGVYKNTKIIAVNASIEAAHAGASGLAFKVVAQEVKDLAERSNQIVDRMQKAHKNMMDEVGSMRKSLDDMEEHMHSVME